MYKNSKYLKNDKIIAIIANITKVARNFLQGKKCDLGRISNNTDRTKNNRKTFILRIMQTANSRCRKSPKDFVFKDKMPDNTIVNTARITLITLNNTDYQSESGNR